MRICAIGDCGRPHHANGYCGMHNARWQRTGDPHRVRRPETVAAFWARVDKTVPGGHWIWTGEELENGYGRISTRKKPTPSGTTLAHRAAWELVHGPIPAGLHVDHVCRVKLCVRPHPKHLEPVTIKENVRRGLHGVLRTHCRHGHELTPENTDYEAKTNCRRCRTCRLRRDAARRARLREAASIRQVYSVAGRGEQ